MEISVRDTGIGIPGEQLAHIFDRFFQAGNFKETPLKGTGIGLALTKEIVQLHHGKIDVHSREGRGTEFVIQLPLGREHLQADEIIVSPGAPPDTGETAESREPYPAPAAGESESGSEFANGVEDIDMEAGQGGDERIEAGEPGKNVVLIVEDHTDMRKHIRDSLEPYYTVQEARDGREGIAKAKEVIPDLIVSDVMMPEVDGYELCRQLKTDIKTSHIPIILLTAKASQDSVVEGLETGADDYVTKPFNTPILLSRIKNLIDLRLHLQEKIQKQMLMQPVEIVVSSMDQEFIRELNEVIEKNLSKSGFNVKQLSKKLYMDRATLYRKILALSGESPTEYIRSYRLKRAAQLLRDKAGNVSQVSLDVGFSNMAYFARIFRKKFHKSPSAYQESESQ